MHGISIRFRDAAGRAYRATYLPEVAAEQGWTREETVESLVRKAGYRGAIDAALIQSIHTERYQSRKASLSHDQVYGKS